MPVPLQNGVQRIVSQARSSEKNHHFVQLNIHIEQGEIELFSQRDIYLAFVLNLTSRHKGLIFLYIDSTQLFNVLYRV